MKNIKMQIKENTDFGGVEISLEKKECLEKEKKKVGVFVKLITGAIIGFINGFWGGGGGMVCVPLLTQVIGLPDKKAHATTLLIMLPLSIASLVVYILGRNMLWLDAIKIGVGFVAGGYIGALILKKISNVWLCATFSIIIIVGGVKLLL